MNAHPASTEMGRGRGNAPFPSAPSPKITLGRLHKTLDTPSTRQRLQRDQEVLASKRERLLGQIRADIELPPTQNDEVLSDVNSISEHLVDLESQYEAVGTTVKRAESRVEEIATLGQLLENEMAKLQRTSEAGAVLADLRVTHCPACDRPVDKDSATDGSCYVCHRQVDVINDAAATRRLDFEKEQVESEREEAKQLLKALEDDLLVLRARQSEVREKIGELRATLKPVQQAAAAVLPPELFLLDVEFGRIQERSQQLSRIGAILAKRESLAENILIIQQELIDLERGVHEQAADVDFESLSDHLRDGFMTYLNGITSLNPNSWLGAAISVRVSERSFRFRVSESNWKTKLGATQRLYFSFCLSLRPHGSSSLRRLTFSRFAYARLPGEGRRWHDHCRQREFHS